ncbi:MAG: hypothetical protein JNJ78_13305 [Anaerolineae bacterium]|nr:hypothetical protein [Anaerolineae bacterium]
MKQERGDKPLFCWAGDDLLRWIVDTADVAGLPPLLTAGTGVDGAQDWHLTAGRRLFGAFGCGKYGVGCRHAAMAAGSRETAADKERVDAGRWETAAEWRRQRRHIRQSGWTGKGRRQRLS